MIIPEYLDMSAVADRLGVGSRSIREYLYRSRKLRAAGKHLRGTYNFPEPDDQFGRSPVWKVSTIQRWERQSTSTRPDKHEEN